MTAIPSHLAPSSLTGPLRAIARRQWFVVAAVGVLRTLIAGLCILLGAALILGALPGLWMPVRVVLAALAWLTVLAAAVIFLRPALRRWNLSRAAQHVEQLHRNVEERLSSAVELAEERDPLYRGSPALVDHLVRQAEADAAAVVPERIIPHDPIVRWALAFVPVLLAWLLVVLVPATTRTALTGLYRLLMPWRNTLPLVLTDVVLKPGDITLTQGDSLDITAHVTFRSGGERDTRHAMLVRLFDNGQKLTEQMEQAGSHDYRSRVDEVQQSFKYMVSADAGESSWFTATVHPRPAITGIDVRYDFPAYTGLAARTDSGLDGAIDALVGTRVTLTIHTALPVVLDKSRVITDEGRPEQLMLPLKLVQPGRNEYQATILINHSCDYKIDLTNDFDLTNRGEQPRSIVADPDEVPTIVIDSPESTVTVRPDDTVPVKYTATDDFGVSKIEAILKIDDGEPRTVPVKFKATDKRNVNGPPFDLSVADVLQEANLGDANHITYQLKVTDNRDPDPQHSFSARQTLKLNKNESQSFRSKLDQKIAQDLTQAIQKAIYDLDRNKPRLEHARDRDVKEHLEDWQKTELQEATKELPRASKDLSKAADDATDTVFDDVARTVKEIADTPMRDAAEDAARAQLSGEGAERHDSAEKSVKEIAQARESLQKLLEKQVVQNRQHEADAARALAEAARKQQEAADKMQPQQVAQHDQDARKSQEEAIQKQQQAIQKLHQAIDQAEPLRDPKAQETAQKLQDLIRKVEDLEKQQTANSEQTQKHEAATQVQEKANTLARQQEDLNKQIEQSRQQHKQPLEQAGANPPPKDHQDNIVKELNGNKLQQAHDQMRDAANQLRQEARQLQDLAASRDLRPDQSQQEALNTNQRRQDQANEQQNKANQASDALNQDAAKNEAPKPDDDALHQADQVAQEVQKEAGDLDGQDHEAQQAMQDAQAAQEAAKHAVAAANPQDAQKQLQQAAKSIRKAGEELAKAAQKKSERQKAQMVKQQQENAKSASEEAKQEAEKQEALAKAIEGDRQQLAQIHQNQQPLDQSAQQERQLADRTKEAEHQAQELHRQAESAHNRNIAARAEKAQQELTRAERHENAGADAQQQAQSAQHQAEDAGSADEASAAQQKASDALQQAGKEQQQAQDALAQAEKELRQLPHDLADAEQGQEGGKPHGGENGEGSDREGGGIKHALQQAAQSAQEANQAQQEAMQQNPDAAREAARALNEAARQMARAVPGALHQGESANQPGQEQAEEPGQEAEGQEASTTPGQSQDSKQGITMALTGLTSLPAAVRDIGITPDQWTRLPPMAKKDLLNAAQQSGPPAYRQMIKEYYVRVAKMQDAQRSVR